MNPGSNRERLYDAFTGREVDTEAQIGRALYVGADYLDLPIGFFTRIEDGIREIRQVTGDHERIRVGETCPLEDADCRRTIELDSALAVQDVSASVIDDETSVDAVARRPTVLFR